MNAVITLFLCVTFSSVAHSLTDEEKHAIHNECSAETGIDEATVMNAMAGEFSDDPKFKQYLFCFGKKMGLVNDAGEIQRGVMKAKLMTIVSDETMVEEMVIKCAVEKDTPEETVYEASKCMHAIRNV